MRRVPGEHTPNNKNRSSKHLTCMTKIRSIYRCMSGEMLRSLVDNNKDIKAEKEINRRKKLKKNNQTPNSEN